MSSSPPTQFPAPLASATEFAYPLPTSKTHPVTLTLPPPTTMASPSGSNLPSPAEFDASNPCSAFYSHPTTRTSFEQLQQLQALHMLKAASNTNVASVAVTEKDMDSVTSLPRYYGRSSRSQRTSIEPTSGCSQKSTQKPCQMLAQRCALDGQKGWNPLRRFSRVQQVWIKVFIALVIVGVAVGIGIGISKAVGGGVWKSQNEQTPIGARSLGALEDAAVEIAKRSVDAVNVVGTRGVKALMERGMIGR